MLLLSIIIWYNLSSMWSPGFQNHMLGIYIDDSIKWSIENHINHTKRWLVNISVRSTYIAALNYLVIFVSIICSGILITIGAHIQMILYKMLIFSGNCLIDFLLIFIMFLSAASCINHSRHCMQTYVQIVLRWVSASFFDKIKYDKLET